MLRLIDGISKHHDVPIKKWLAEGATFKYIGANVDKQRGVRNVCSDHVCKMIHILQLEQHSHVADLMSIPWKVFLPINADIQAVKHNLLILVSRLLTNYIKDLSPLSKSVPQHIKHQYTQEISMRLDVAVLDVLMKNETCRADMVQILQSTCMQMYLGDNHPPTSKITSGGDQLTCE